MKRVEARFIFFALCVDIQMTLTLMLLPLLLSEAPFAINSGERRRKRSVWKPSSVETMENFVDLQEVHVVYIGEGGVVYCDTD